MALNWNFPIRYKILIVLSVVVCAAVAVYLYLASKIFYEDKTLLVYELNQNNVRVLAKELDTHLENLIKQGKLFADLAGNSEKISAFEAVKDEAIFEIRFTANDGKTTKLTWPEALRPFQMSADELASIYAGVDRNAAKSIVLKSFFTSAKGDQTRPPLLLIQQKIGSGLVTMLTRADLLTSTFVRSGIAHVYIFDREGNILFGGNDAQDGRRDPLFTASKVGQLRSEVRQFDLDGKKYLGSWYRLDSVPLVAASRVEVGEAFAAARLLVRKSVIYAVIIVTVAFMIALVFSHTLTEPIHRMLEATYRIAKGDFSNLIHVRSHDELAVLAASFNAMTVDLKSSRSQIEEYSRDLENKVIDRTAKLEAQNVAIREAQDALIRTTRLASVGEVAGRAAHEVLNPLTNIVARLEKKKIKLKESGSDDVRILLEIATAWKRAYDNDGIDALLQEFSKESSAYPGRKMLEEDLSNLAQISANFENSEKEFAKDVDFLLQESNRISKIVNGMRSLTRVSGNRKKIDVISVANDALNASLDVLNKAGIAFDGPKGDQIFINADRDEVIQVLNNLVRNSMQALFNAASAPEGLAKRIWITAVQVESPAGKRCQIRVSDNGPGIAPENYENIFETSFTTKTVEEGTGLGLSIARRFIRAYDGELSVEKSLPYKETVFLIDLPIYEES